MSDDGADESSVRGERDVTSVGRAPSIQSRISSFLAIGLMSVLGLGMLTWYYANAMTRQSRARQSARTLSTSRAQGDMPLPSLGRIDPPPPPPGPAFDATRFSPLDSPAAPLNPTSLREIPLEASPPPVAGASAPKTPEELTLERQLSGVVYSAQNVMPSVSAGTASAGSPHSESKAASGCVRSSQARTSRHNRAVPANPGSSFTREEAMSTRNPETPSPSQ